MIGGKYKLLQELGRGGFGLTYLAEDLNLLRQVVVKVPNKAMRNEEIYKKFLARFRREGQALARVRHPHVVRVMEFFEENQTPCIVMEYVEGHTLQTWVSQNGKLSPETAVQQFRGLAQALCHVHQAELIHCDIKPENLIRTPNGELVLIDFGSTKLLTEHSTTVTTAISKGYAAYEAGLEGYKASPTLDVYSLAATLYFAVTGQKPVGAMERKLVAATLTPPQDLVQNCPDWLNQAILKGMALEPRDRPASMQIWVGSLYPPQQPARWRKADSSNVTLPLESLPSPNPSREIRHPSPLPYRALLVFALGNFPLGLVIGLSSYSDFSVGTWALTWAWALAGAGALVLAWAWAWALAGAWNWAWAVAGTLAGTGSWALAWALPFAWAWAWADGLAGAWYGAWPGAWNWSWAWAWALAGAWNWALAWTGSKSHTLATIFFAASALGGVVVGGIVGYFSATLNVLQGLGSGIVAVFQWWLMIVGGGSSATELNKRFSNVQVFGILGGFSSVGLGIGLGIGILLALTGVELP
jgi:serine/threonine-protein kinase